MITRDKFIIILCIIAETTKICTYFNFIKQHELFLVLSDQEEETFRLLLQDADVQHRIYVKAAAILKQCYTSYGIATTLFYLKSSFSRTALLSFVPIHRGNTACDTLFIATRNACLKNTIICFIQFHGDRKLQLFSVVTLVTLFATFWWKIAPKLIKTDTTIQIEVEQYDRNLE